MKTSSYVLFFLSLFFNIQAQDTTRILFIGNSFTYYNNMPQLVKELAGAANLPVITGMHAPGGISVGDVSQGQMAHMNNPALFSLIRSRKWDYAVIQDNQGRFVRDSAQFPSTASSLVVQGHLNIMDSVKANNSCAKIILFGGWAWKAGMPPFGNTGIETIQRILTNYVVLNDTMKETVAPIGVAWIKAVNYLPAVDLWDPDGAHPAYPGSFLTASVIFSTIFNLPAKNLNYNGTLTAATAYNLRAFADTSVFALPYHTRFNLGGARKLAIQPNGGQLTVPGIYSAYAWYKNNVLVGNTATLNMNTNGTYRAELRENDGCLVKSCNYTELFLGLQESTKPGDVTVYPNPVKDNYFSLMSNINWDAVELYDMCGNRENIVVETSATQTEVFTKNLKVGCYVLLLVRDGQETRKKVIITGSSD